MKVPNRALRSTAVALAGLGLALISGPHAATAQEAEMSAVGAALATGFPFRIQARIDTYLRVFRAVFLEAQSIRRAGSAALRRRSPDGFFCSG